MAPATNELNYAYVHQVNRLFGSDADAPLVAGPPPFDNVQDVAADGHLLNASYAFSQDLKFGAYAYLMDFPDKRNWDNNTFGGSVKWRSGWRLRSHCVILRLHGHSCVVWLSGVTHGAWS